jgi:type I restriction enzyme R subunit
MVGDTCDADVAGPINAGLQAIWLRRNNAPSDEWISNLNQVMARISGEKYPDQEYAHCPCPAAQVYSPINNENRRPARVIACSSKTPRYYQLNAINRTVQAIAAGQNRVLLVMATGTGKTYTAFQIIWRLWKSRAKKRILFLADRNILIDQTMVNDFRPFKGAMAKLSPNAKGVERINAQGQVEVEELELAVHRTTKKVDTSYEIYLSLYQAVTGTEEENNIYKQFSPDFFDLIVVDECHRGSAAEDSAWRDILSYFSSATQVGLTATPKETEDVSNIDYFGEPVYTYSLRQGIEDGYLRPTRSSASIWTKTPSAGAPPPA